jgi:hypothetical protein
MESTEVYDLLPASNSCKILMESILKLQRREIGHNSGLQMKWEIHNKEDILSAILRGCKECLEDRGWHFKTCLKCKLKCRGKIYSKFSSICRLPVL